MAPWCPAPSCVRVCRAWPRAGLGASSGARRYSARPQDSLAAVASRPCSRRRPADCPARPCGYALAAPYHAASWPAAAAPGCAGVPRGADSPTGRSAWPCRSARSRSARGAHLGRLSLLDVAVELRLGEICAGPLQGLVGLARFAHFAFEFLDALGLDRRGPLLQALVPFGLSDPASQRLHGAPDLGCDRLDCRPLRVVLFPSSTTMRTARSAT